MSGVPGGRARLTQPPGRSAGTQMDESATDGAEAAAGCHSYGTDPPWCWTTSAAGEPDGMGHHL